MIEPTPGGLKSVHGAFAATVSNDQTVYAVTEHDHAALQAVDAILAVFEVILAPHTPSLTIVAAQRNSAQTHGPVQQLQALAPARLGSRVVGEISCSMACQEIAYRPAQQSDPYQIGQL